MNSADRLETNTPSFSQQEKQKKYQRLQKILNWVNTLIVIGTSFMPIAPVTAQEIITALSPEECAARGYIDPEDWAYIFGESAEAVSSSAFYNDPTQVFGLDITEPSNDTTTSPTERNWALDDLGIPEGGLVLDPPRIVTDTAVITDSLGITSSIEVTRPDYTTIAIIDSGSRPELPTFFELFNDGVFWDHYDVRDNDCVPTAEHYHGVFMLGLMGSDNSDISVFKYNSDSDPALIPVRVLVIGLLDKNNAASWTNLFRALIVAKNADADFISLSVGAKNPSQTLKDQLNRAVDLLRYNGTDIIVAAGNNPDSPDLVPGCLENNVRVVATTEDGDLSPLSNAACNHLPKGTVAAPGYQVLGYNLDGTIIPGSGTSMATPLVALRIALYANQYGKQLAWPAMQANLRTDANNPDFGLGEIDYSTNNPPTLPPEPDLGLLPPPPPKKLVYLPAVFAGEGIVTAGAEE